MEEYTCGVGELYTLFLKRSDLRGTGVFADYFLHTFLELHIFGKLCERALHQTRFLQIRTRATGNTSFCSQWEKSAWKHPVWKKKTNVFLGFPVQRWHHVRFAMISIRWLLFHPKQPKGGQKRGTIKKVRWSVNFVSNYSELVAQNLIQKKLEPLFEWVPRVRLRRSDVLRTGNFVGILKNPGGQQTGWPFKSYSPICLIMPRRSKG